jgi:preprotein translocase subunit SecG
MYIFLIVLDILVAITLITSVLLQPSKADGFKGFITGNSETFYSKNKSRTREAFLVKLTIASAILFAVITLTLNIIGK